MPLGSYLRSTSVCPSCQSYTLKPTNDGVTIFRNTRLDGSVAMNVAFNSGSMIVSELRCASGCPQPVVLTALIRQMDLTVLDGTKRKETLIDVLNMHPAPPLFATDASFHPASVVHCHRLFELYWIDPLAALNAMRSAVEGVTKSIFMARKFENSPKHTEFQKHILRKRFEQLSEACYSDPFLQKVADIIWKAGSTSSHYSGDVKFQGKAAKILDTSLSLFETFLWATSSRIEGQSFSETEECKELGEFFSRENVAQRYSSSYRLNYKR